MPTFGFVSLSLSLARQVSRGPLPRTRGKQKVPGLTAPVEILRDRWGVPHIYAQGALDLWFAQGYVHAQDRLWQMEFNRRLGHGRMAEIFGSRALHTDRLLRLVGFSRAAAADLAHMGEGARQALEAYAHGVNAWMAVGRLPLEFRLLRFRPAPWQVTDTLVWGKMIGWSMSINWPSEVVHSAMVERLGPKRAAKLQGDYPADNPSVLPTQASLQMFEHFLAQLRVAESWFPASGLVGMSNNWVVDGTMSATGHPLLASDPHMTTLQPGIWYENHLQCPELEVTGVSMPGAPGVVMGHNADIAWGMTAAFPDTQDLYLERLHPNDPHQYEYLGQWEQAQVLQEEIRVRGERAPRVVEVTVTRHGPIINEASPLTSGAGLTALALRWTGHDPGGSPNAILSLNRAHDWTSFSAALADWHEPALNFVYADRQGNIGYHMAGRVPKRASGTGMFPTAGWTGANEWIGWVPHEELPHALNPAQHYFASANNQIVGPDYPHFLSAETANGFRAQRIVELLTAQEKHSASGFAHMQVDLSCQHSAGPFCRLVTTLAPGILAQPASAGVCAQAEQALTYLRDWDYELSADSVGGCIYQAWQHYTMRRIFEPWLGDLTDHYLGVGFDKLLTPVIFYYVDRSPLVAQRILLQNEREWLVDDGGNLLEREEILALALRDAITFLNKQIGPQVSTWEWGRLHRVQFRHVFGAVKILEKIFCRGPYPYGGDPNTVWQGGFLPKLPIDPWAAVSASWRQILDVSDWDACLGVLPTGQSGHPASEHYDDMTALWLRGELHPLYWTRDRIEAVTEARLLLEP